MSSSLDRLPLTYGECRARFERATTCAGIEVERHAIAALGPDGSELSIDAALIGDAAATKLLVVLSGVHGVEGFIGSALQCDLLGRLEEASLPAETAVLLVHAVNPWGMAWGRRENESNVDLNRNWRRSEVVPEHNEAYDELHELACPDAAEMPDVDELLASAAAVVAERGLVWVRDAITTGQYGHADGLHYGGERTEASNLVLEGLVEQHVDGREHVLVIDLHTGHGPPGALTLLSDQPPDAPQHRFFERCFPGAEVEATVGNADATTGLKQGQIANGIRARLEPGRCWSTSAELGTSSDLEQLAATYQARWVHHHGDRARPEHAAALWRYRCCFTPDDRSWERTAMARGRTLLDQAVVAAGRLDGTADQGSEGA